jgi:hypothetical protein
MTPNAGTKRRDRTVSPRLARLVGLALLCGALFAPAGAQAASDPVLKDCADGKIDGSYSQAQYKKALRHIPTDVDEYTDCRDLIRRAQLRDASGGKSGNDDQFGGIASDGASDDDGSVDGLLASASPSEKAALEAVTRGKDGGGPISVGGRTVTPGAADFTSEDVRNGLPPAVVATLVALGLMALAAAGYTARRRGANLDAIRRVFRRGH